MFIELSLKTGQRILVNTSTVTNIFENKNGDTVVCHEGENTYPVTQSFDEVMSLINKNNNHE